MKEVPCVLEGRVVLQGLQGLINYILIQVQSGLTLLVFRRSKANGVFMCQELSSGGGGIACMLVSCGGR